MESMFFSLLSIFIPIVAHPSAANLDVFAVILSNWAKMSGALFAQVVRHCIDGEQYFEDIIKMLVVSVQYVICIL